MPWIALLAVVALVVAGSAVGWALSLRGRAERAEAAGRDRVEAVAAREAELGRRSEELSAREAEAASILSRAQEDADGLRRTARDEVTALRDATREEAARLRDEERERGRREAEEIAAEAKRSRDHAVESVAVARAELAQLRTAHERREQRLAAREDRLDAERARLEDLVSAQERDLAALEERAAEIDSRLAEVERERERVAGLTADAARAEVLAQAEHAARLEAVARARDIEQRATADAEKSARRLLVGAMQRLASDQTAETSVAAVDLPSEDMKGRIIGREGRNIRTFEQVTGVNVLIDDTPGLVLLSCFDPLRREVARIALTDLVQDGRIHPSVIENAHARAVAEVDEVIQRAGEDALAEMRITDIDPALVPVIGALTFRTSYGQNVLRHLVECGHLAALLAAELGLDVDTCRRAAFLHDIGKALTHESEGTHAMVGADLLRRHGEADDIVHAVAAHHNEVEPETVEAVLVQVCDACSGSRPGARRESLESYVQRLERLEEIAQSHPGVDRVFAMQAGRDVRVMVQPDEVDDAEAELLARDIAAQIEDELTYPGQIRVTVVRESRATGIAH